MAYQAGAPMGGLRQAGPPQPPQQPPPLVRLQSVQQPPLNRVPTFENPVVTEEIPPPPTMDTWPCGCHYPGDHHTDCMWSLWEQMRDNYSQTKRLMGQFMSRVDKLQGGDKNTQCQCPPGCHGKDLGEAMGIQQMLGVTVPWLQPAGMSPPSPVSAPQVTGTASIGDYMSESRQQMEEQRRIRNTWVQFLNVFDMALDLANDVSKDRWEAVRKRKERERLERQERRELERRERQERREQCAEERRDSRDKEESETKETKEKEKPKRESEVKEAKMDSIKKDSDQRESEAKKKSVISRKSDTGRQSAPTAEEPTPEAKAAEDETPERETEPTPEPGEEVPATTEEQPE